MVNAFSEIARELFEQKPGTTTYTFFPRATTQDELYQQWGLDSGILTQDRAALDGVEVQAAVGALNQALDPLRAEGYKDVSKIEAALKERKYETKLYAGGRILEVMVAPKMSIALIYPETPRKELSNFAKGRRIIAPQGLSNIYAMIIQHWSEDFDYPYTVGKMEEAEKRGKVLRYKWNYPGAVKDSIIETGESKFKEAHGVGLSNYGELPHREMLNIGRSEKSKLGGVKPLNWKLLEVRGPGDIRELLEVTQVPYNVGVDGFIIYVQPGWRLVVGGRGGSTKLGNMLIEGKEDELEKIEKYRMFIGMLEKALEAMPSDTKGIEIAVENKLVRGQPTKFYDLLGVYFYTKENLPRIV